MVFDDSTSGVVRSNLARLESLGFKTSPALDPWTTSLPPVDRAPIVFTDTLISMSHRWSSQRLNVGPGAPEPMAEAVARLPLELFERRRERQAGQRVERIAPDGEKSTLNDADAVRDLIRH
jgi:hypothetical protein